MTNSGATDGREEKQISTMDIGNLRRTIKTSPDPWLYLLQIIGVAINPLVAGIAFYSIYTFAILMTASKIPENILTTLFYTTDPTGGNLLFIFIGTLLLVAVTLILVTAPLGATKNSPIKSLTRNEQYILGTLTISFIVSFSAAYILLLDGSKVGTGFLYVAAVIGVVLLFDLSQRSLSEDNNTDDKSGCA